MLLNDLNKTQMMKWNLFSICILFFLTSHAQDYHAFPFWNYNLPLEKRVNDLVSRLTLEEKVAQMLNETPAIPRLGILAYDWWNETLHGVARTPFKVTSYPQAIAMAATWDTSAMFRMADFSADEGRAIYNKAVELNRTNERYLGLTYWTPNINIFRDPRWGRGQETYGEDPFLTSMLASAFVNGLQGNDSTYLKAAACAKHFAVHSGPEPSRHVDNINPSLYDLWDTYLPAFKELIVNSKVAGVMCAYNAVNSQPCCGNDLLMNDILRNQWKFKGYVTSDCWAIDDFFRYHKTHKDAITSSVDAVMHGTDVECGNSVYRTLIEAVKTGLIKEEQLDISLKRLFTIRFRLGMFDPVSVVKYAQIPITELESPAHKSHALKMAQESIILLKNQDNILPLTKKLKKIALIGPNADNSLALLGNYNGTPTHVTTLLEGIREKLGKKVEVIYEKEINYTNDSMFVYSNLSSQYSKDGSPGVLAEYFNNILLKGTPTYIQTESDIDHYWAEGQSPALGIDGLHFSARYTTTFTAKKDDTIHFEIEGDDGYKLFIDEKLIIDNWEKINVIKSFRLPVRIGEKHKIVIEYFQKEGNAFIKLKAGNYRKANFTALAQQLKDVDAIVFAGGISPQLEGEEMPVTIAGFNGGDRTSIQLPAVQTELMKALKTTGKPVIFVMMTGSAIAIPWEEKNIPGIINAWYGGQSAGTAIADVIFGDYNPAGRLPVTFFKSDSDLPDFKDYSMKDRTYRYFKGEALYPFGYGLSYTRFKYDSLRTPPKIAKGEMVNVSVRVTNFGKRDGEEVVQLYVSNQNKKFQSPLKALKGFRRIVLKAGDSQIVYFELTPEQLSLVDDNGKLYQPDSKFIISVGGGQPSVANKTTSNVVYNTIEIK